MDYTNTLLYSAKCRSKIKNGRLTYFVCREFDGENLIVEKVKSPPADMAISNSGAQRFQWCIHNLDILAEKYNITILKNKSDSKEDANAN